MKKKSPLEKIVAALPSRPNKARTWTLEEDAVILRYADEKGFEAIGRIIGVGGITVRRRHIFLKSRMKVA